MTPDIRHPDITVQLTGQGGNAFAILGRVARALRTAGVSPEAACHLGAGSAHYRHAKHGCTCCGHKKVSLWACLGVGMWLRLPLPGGCGLTHRIL